MSQQSDSVVYRISSGSETSEGDYEIDYAPIISLPEVVVATNEEDEEVIEQLRAKLYRFDRSDNEAAEWKERGTGEVKLLKHITNKTVRIVMRRDKTLKVCANHFITPLMELKPKAELDKAFVYNVPADFSDGQIKSECLAIRFANVDFALRFKKAFLDSQEFVKKECTLYNGTEPFDSNDESNEEESENDSNDDESEVNNEDKVDKINKIEPEATDKVTEQLSDLTVSKEI